MTHRRIVLVTGASGFIGRHSLLPLIHRGYEVHAVSRNFTKTTLPTGVNSHSVDLLDTQAIRRLVRSVSATHLLHFAWYVSHGKFWEAPENLSWTSASLSLIREFSEEGGKRVVLAGSCGEYDWGYSLCDELLTPLNPATLYGTCKKCVHAISARYGSNAALSVATGRIFFLYGPHEPQSRLVPSVILSLLAGRTANCTHGRQIRDFLHVEDAGAYFAALIDSSIEGPVNIASGNPVSIAELVQFIGKEIGRPDLIRLGAIPLSPTEPMDLRAEVRRLREELGVNQARSLSDGIRDTIAWWRNNYPR